MHLFILQNQVLNVLPEDTFTYQTYNLYSESFTSFCLHSRTIKRSLNGANFSTIGCVLQCSYFIYSCSLPPPIHNEIHLSNCVPTPLPTYLLACLSMEEACDGSCFGLDFLRTKRWESECFKVAAWLSTLSQLVWVRKEEGEGEGGESKPYLFYLSSLPIDRWQSRIKSSFS